MSVYTALKVMSAVVLAVWYAWDRYRERNGHWVLMTTDMNEYPFRAPATWSRAMACRKAEREYALFLWVTRQRVATVWLKRLP